MYSAPKKSKMDDAWDRATSGKKTLQRKKPSPDIATQVRKALTDNFRGMSSEELDGVLRDGLTLRQRLQQDKRQNAETPGSVQFGKLYYSELRALYSGSDKIEQKLVADKSLVVRPELLDVAARALRHPPQRATFVQLLARVSDLNQAETVGIPRWCLQLNPALSAEQLNSAKAVMQCVARLGLAAKFPTELNLMREKFDEILLQAQPVWGQSKNVQQMDVARVCKVDRTQVWLL